MLIIATTQVLNLINQEIDDTEKQINQLRE